MIKKNTKNFTLIEILISVSILSIAAVALGWQMKNMISAHHFYKDMNHLVTDLRKSQLIALSDRSDIGVKIYREKEGYSYQFQSDCPLPFFITKRVKLTGVREIKQNHKPVQQLFLSIYSTGRIEPCQEIEFIQNETRSLILDLKSPLIIELKRVDLL